MGNGAAPLWSRAIHQRDFPPSFPGSSVDVFRMTAHSFHQRHLILCFFGQHQQQQLEEDLGFSSHFLLESKLVSLLLELDIENVSLSIRHFTVDDTNGMAMLQRNLSPPLATCNLLRVLDLLDLPCQGCLLGSANRSLLPTSSLLLPP